jgi:DNA-binding PadR family transcriptional regulator
MGKRRNAGPAVGQLPAEKRQPIRSAITWALLGLLIERPGYGYELVARYEREYGEHLPITSDGQIYRGLDRLREHRFIEEESSDPASPPRGTRQPKPNYRVTGLGIRAYADWLAASVWASREQAQVLIRELVSLSDKPALALAVLDAYEARCLREQRVSREELAAAQVPGRAGLLARLAGEERSLALRALLPWCQHARAELQAYAASEASRSLRGTA